MRNKKRKIAYVTGTRADFGLMTSILKHIDQDKRLDLLVYATGMHLMPSFGSTIRDVKKMFPQTKLLRSVFGNDMHGGAAEFTARFIAQLAMHLQKDRPDIVMVLGDRPEMLSTALACLYLGIPVAHVHGGERSSTADEIARHAITKLSHIHLVATKDSAERVKKMGEDAWRIHVVGAPALDVILNEKLPTRSRLFDHLHLKPVGRFILLTQHPVSGELGDTSRQIRETLKAVKSFRLPVISIYPHADAGGRTIIRAFKVERNNPLFHVYPSIPYRSFLALERECAVWVGNSSGAMIESASFHAPVVNVGTRQDGRFRGANVIDVGYAHHEIEEAIQKSLYDGDYLQKLKKIKNPWGDGHTGKRVTKILREIAIDSKLINKQIAY